MSAKPESGPTPAEVLHGGIQNLDVVLWDGSVESVTLRMLPVREYEAFARALENEPRMAEILCGKAEDWGDTLRPDSLGKVVSEGERINADFFVPWFQRRAARMERLVPGSVAKLAAGSPSPTSSPRSATAPA